MDNGAYRLGCRMAALALPRADREETNIGARLARLTRRLRPPSMVVWMLLSAVLFLAGAAHASLAGATMVAKIGVLGATAAIAFIAAFSG
jgi:hypothetical protein